jgi:hypothetical protein
MSTTFEKAQVGDKVWSVGYGHGEIVIVCNNSGYPLVVKFTNYLNTRSYTLQGQLLPGELQTLFWQEIKFEAPMQLRMKLINGVEVPDISFHPNDNEYYYYPELTQFLYDKTFFIKCIDTHEFRSANNLCYPFTEEGKQAAILHAKAMLGISV